eukprot:TRINITY_DN7129_c0_g1_i1.p1 TRINITY_DN7129_c0_g1~~TRINITY_DN7129_c0_g1_i1.p1  ORF type:complete len:1038 (+),score=222.29 TRINITY_DN7129_c0_g1_i1:137-3250(+)
MAGPTPCVSGDGMAAAASSETVHEECWAAEVDAAVSVQEPEAEAEADGWEIVSHYGDGSERSRLGSGDFGAHQSEQAIFGVDDLPEDLVRGCLDEDCDAQFSEECVAHRCGFCRLLFCEKHLMRFQLTNVRCCSPRLSSRDIGTSSSGVTRVNSSGRPRLSSGSGGFAPAQLQPAALAEAALGPLAAALPGTVPFCRECRAVLAPAALSSSSPASSPRSQAPGQQPRREGIDLSAVASQVQALQKLRVAELRAGCGSSEPAGKEAARNLLLRLLGRLRVCTRPWADVERDWVWHLVEELVAEEPGWIAQFARQADWEREGLAIAGLVEDARARGALPPREAVQVLGCLGRRAATAAAVLGERRLGLVATRAAEAAASMEAIELACCLELLLDAAEALGAAGATGGRRAVMSLLLRAARGAVGSGSGSGAGSGGSHNGDSEAVAEKRSDAAAAFGGELFWALEARLAAGQAGLPPPPPVARPGVDGATASPAAERAAWVSVALQELLRSLPAEAELGLLRQRAWVRHLERGEVDAARAEPGPWCATRAFPLAVWSPRRLCLGAQGRPRASSSKCAPLIVRCRCREVASPSQASAQSGESAASGADGLGKADDPHNKEEAGSDREANSPPASPRLPRARAVPRGPEFSAGILLKRDAGMHREQQVGQTLRLLERLIWEDRNLLTLLTQLGLEPEDVRATYTIAMTGPGTAIVEFVDGASTLREVRAGARGRVAPSTLLEYLRQHNSSRGLATALARLGCTSAISAVLSFVAGLGDRHHENFMVTTDGRLLHVDYGYALGREPFDSVLIHYAVQGGAPAATVQYEELSEALGPDLMRRVFWPIARAAFRRVRQHAGLLVELVHTAVVRDVRWGGQAHGVDERGWATAQAFVTRRCATVLSEPCAERFIHSLLWHCARHERGAKFRDELKGLRLRERTQQAVSRAYGAALSTGRGVSSVVGAAAGVAIGGTGGTRALLQRSSGEARGTAFGLVAGVRELLRDTCGITDAHPAASLLPPAASAPAAPAQAGARNSWGAPVGR